MKKLLFILILPALAWGQESRLIKGKITDGSQALSDVAIAVEGETGEVYTSSEGRYEIEAAPGDVLTYHYTGMKEVRIRVEDVTRFLNLVLVPEYTELDEVTMTRRLKSQDELQREYPLNEKIFMTAFGYMEPDAMAGRVRLVTGDEINPIGICLLDYLRNRFANITVQGNCSDPDEGRVFLRARSSIFSQAPVIFDVDGMIYNSAPAWLDLNLIERMAIIYNRSMAVRYGSIGAGGVIVINTSNVNYTVPPTGADVNPASYPSALGLSANAANDPAYLRDLRAAGSTGEAQSVYESYADRSVSPFFYLDAYDHFYSERGDREFAEQLIVDNYAKLNKSAVLLKALGYLYQEQGRDDAAQEVFKEIFILRPEYSQSYLDMANAYRDNGQSAKAAALFGRYLYLLREGFLIGSDDFWFILQHDADNLFQRSGEDLGMDMRRASTDPYLQGATRLVFEWNDSEAEFELQFVNPEGQAYSWNHTFAENSERIEDEKISGYSTAEYVIDPATPGPWKVNLTYHGNKSLTPTYLKLKTYYHFGTGSERSEVRTFKLSLKGANQELQTLVNPGIR